MVSNLFERQRVVDKFLQHRSEHGAPYDPVEHGAVLRLVSEAKRGAVLDLGCGCGGLISPLVELGFSPYAAVDGSIYMLNEAKKNANGACVEYLEEDIRRLLIKKDAYSLIVSSLTIHFIDDISRLIANIFMGLIEGGRFVFSVRHPIRTSNPGGEVGPDATEDWLISDYFSQGSRRWHWLGEEFLIFHRSIESYFHELTRAGFKVTALCEPTPPDRLIGSPPFLVIAADKQQ